MLGSILGSLLHIVPSGLQRRGRAAAGPLPLAQRQKQNREPAPPAAPFNEVQVTIPQPFQDGYPFPLRESRGPDQSLRP